MDYDLAAKRDQAPTLYTWVLYTFLAFGFGVGCWMLIYLATHGAELRAAVENQRSAEIKQENLEVCTKLGMPPETKAFVNCTTELMHIRQRHDERLHRDFYFQ